MECAEFIYNDEYADFLIDFNYDRDEIYRRYNPDCVNFLNDKYAIVYKNIKESGVFDNERFSFNVIGYDSFPKLYTLLCMNYDKKVKGRAVKFAQDNLENNISTDFINEILEETGVSSIRRFDGFDLTGRDILIGFIDTGINYLLDIFRFEDGTSKIRAIWDQSFTEEENTFFDYGRVYDTNEINKALSVDNPFDIVKTVDSSGHGTSLASLVSAIASDAEMVVVKLKEAKKSLKRFYGIDENILCYADTDIMAGILFLEDIARRENKPLVICMGIGTNQGEHEGRGYIGDVINELSNSPGIAVVVAGGNELTKRHHFRGDILINDELEDSVEEIELNIGANIKGAFLEIWTQNPNDISIGIISPTGEVIPMIMNNNNNSELVRLLFDNTSILVAYDNNVSSSGNALVYVRFFYPKEGIWKLRIYENSLIEGRYDIWLPISGLINSRYEFVKSSPDTTLSQIANVPYAITVSGYNHRSGGIYVDSSRGYTFDERIKPDIAAPAVDINVINNRGDVMTMSGTSIASAITSGLVAMLFEWGIVNRNYRNMDGVIAKKMLIRGAVTVNGIMYPNKEWGYGKVNIYETFDRIRSN